MNLWPRKTIRACTDRGDRASGDRASTDRASTDRADHTSPHKGAYDHASLCCSVEVCAGSFRELRRREVKRCSKQRLLLSASDEKQGRPTQQGPASVKHARLCASDCQACGLEQEPQVQGHVLLTGS